MNVREYLSKLPENEQVTFVVSESVKSEAGPFQEYRFRCTPIRAAWQWLKSGSFPDDHLVVNADHPPIDATGTWLKWYRDGHLRCAMITTEADLVTMYGPVQGRSMIEYYQRTVN